eukprot:TRINITY_DN55069_c0_g1_i1.p1 TRINITY_DN55069_c0_g1~~TRINITY_DN55069_c0_g1_i1.p1  ORF type:complete len:734 (-),score=151.59 TRINITY_DN55069_c0_g1_i1:47-2176(-)
MEGRYEELTKQQWALIREHVSTTVRELSSLKASVEDLKKADEKVMNDSAQRERRCAENLQREISDLRRSIEGRHEQDFQAHTNELQKLAAALAAQRKEEREFRDTVMQRFEGFEARLSRDVSQAIRDLNESNVQPKVDALKLMHEQHRASVAELLALEKSARQEALNDLRNHVHRRLDDDKAGFHIKFAEEKTERESSVRSALAEERGAWEAAIMELGSHHGDVHKRVMQLEKDSSSKGNDIQALHSRISAEASNREKQHEHLHARIKDEAMNREQRHSELHALLGKESDIRKHQHQEEKHARMRSCVASICGDERVVIATAFGAWRSDIQSKKLRKKETELQDRLARFEKQFEFVQAVLDREQEARKAQEEEQQKTRMRSLLAKLGADDKYHLTTAFHAWKAEIKKKNNMKSEMQVSERLAGLEACCERLATQLEDERSDRELHEREAQRRERERREAVARSALAKMTGNEHHFLAQAMAAWRHVVTQNIVSRSHCSVEERVARLEGCARESSAVASALNDEVHEQQTRMDALHHWLKVDSERLWKAMDSHTHDVSMERMESKALADTPVHLGSGVSTTPKIKTRTLTAPAAVTVTLPTKSLDTQAAGLPVHRTVSPGPAMRSVSPGPTYRAYHPHAVASQPVLRTVGPVGHYVPAATTPPALVVTAPRPLQPASAEQRQSPSNRLSCGQARYSVEENRSSEIEPKLA